MKFKLKDSVRIREENEDKIILFDTETELLHEVNGIGYDIIKLCNGKNTKKDIENILISEFKEIKQDDIKNDITNFIRQLELNNLIEIIPVEIADKIYLYGSELGSFTYYIDDDKKILIDAGVLVKKPIDMIIVTHCHFDHILFLNELKKMNGCEIICGEKDKRDIEELTEKVMVNLSPKNIVPTKVDTVVKNGDVIKTNNFTFSILETPGHTDGSISVYDKHKSILFSGDAWFGGDNQGKWIYLSGSEKQSKDTLNILKKINPKCIFPGHWGIIISNRNYRIQ
ncbi:MAG: PqqD family peptide modification chaperone [Candidatus Aenigmarchaeota archaeon]|nr:PqqD family peptide modification chaperone [Candidatus Aenigmarchaeota archaeon]